MSPRQVEGRLAQSEVTGVSLLPRLVLRYHREAPRALQQFPAILRRLRRVRLVAAALPAIKIAQSRGNQRVEVVGNANHNEIIRCGRIITACGTKQRATPVISACSAFTASAKSRAFSRVADLLVLLVITNEGKTANTGEETARSPTHH